ncbi:hypothetical protein K3M67_12005 [Sphingobium sp. V4]|uniref:hypothetical protein n=1 Tax=Sphingobium sp. V4 TaxID=3038927 RepID=UPI0025580281|nr:hypothetical protein [Sphingobium sp. V4]WIW87689.1 hypothetical protein K3M67_12005 [Sphingobium sp. V4]
MALIASILNVCNARLNLETSQSPIHPFRYSRDPESGRYAIHPNVRPAAIQAT